MIKLIKKFLIRAQEDSFNKAIGESIIYLKKKTKFPNKVVKTRDNKYIVIPNHIHPSYKHVELGKHSGLYYLKSECGKLYFPNKPHSGNVILMSGGYMKHISHKYELEGFVEVSPGDTVIDVGAFIGVFSLYASSKAKDVLSIEPSLENYKCLSKNTGMKKNIITKRVAINESSSEGKLNISNDPTDHFLIDVDSDDSGKSEFVPVRRLDDILKEQKINNVDFLKVEAEGLEPEVLKSVSECSVKK